MAGRFRLSARSLVLHLNSAGREVARKYGERPTDVYQRVPHLKAH